jgi:hypothetical protein
MPGVCLTVTLTLTLTEQHERTLVPSVGTFGKEEHWRCTGRLGKESDVRAAVLTVERCLVNKVIINILIDTEDKMERTFGDADCSADGASVYISEREETKPMSLAI